MCLGCIVFQIHNCKAHGSSNCLKKYYIIWSKSLVPRFESGYCLGLGSVMYLPYMGNTLVISCRSFANVRCYCPSTVLTLLPTPYQRWMYQSKVHSARSIQGNLGEMLPFECYTNYTPAKGNQM